MRLSQINPFTKPRLNREGQVAYSKWSKNNELNKIYLSKRTTFQIANIKYSSIPYSIEPKTSVNWETKKWKIKPIPNEMEFQNSNRCTVWPISNLNKPSIYQKIASDAYAAFGKGFLKTTKTRLIVLKPGEYHFPEVLRFVVQICSGYTTFDSIYVPEQDSNYNTPVPLLTYISREAKPPTQVFFGDSKVPLTGLVELLALGKILGDEDLIGSHGEKCAIQWIFKNGTCVEGRVVKCDFEELTPMHTDLFDIPPKGKDIRLNCASHMKWDNFSPEQKNVFLKVLLKCKFYGNDESGLDFLVYRDGQFNLRQEEANQITKIMKAQIMRTIDIYRDELRLYMNKHFTPSLKTAYLGTLGKHSLERAETIFADERYTDQPLFSEKSNDNSNPVAFSELFKQDRKVLIHGPRGIGKSIFVRKTAFDWASGKLSENTGFDIVCVLPLSDLNKHANDLTSTFENYGTHEFVAEVLLKTVLKSVITFPENSSEELSEYLKENWSKVLILIDGYDQANEKLKTIVKDLLRSESTGQKSLQPYILVSSRPFNEDLDDLQSSWLDASYQLAEPSIKNYCDTFFSDTPSLSQQLIEYLEKVPSLLNIVRFPAELKKLCILWQKAKIPPTLTMIMDTLSVPNNGCSALQKAAYDAFKKGWPEDSLLFTNHIDPDLLTRTNFVFTERYAFNDCYKLHPLAKEYLVACYVSDQLNSDHERKEFFQTHLDEYLEFKNRQIATVLQFIAGRLISAERANEFFQIFKGKFKPGRALGLQLLLYCLNEYVAKFGLVETIAHSLNDLLELTKEPEVYIDTLTITQWIEEEKLIHAARWIEHQTLQGGDDR